MHPFQCFEDRGADYTCEAQVCLSTRRPRGLCAFDEQHAQGILERPNSCVKTSAREAGSGEVLALKHRAKERRALPEGGIRQLVEHDDVVVRVLQEMFDEMMTNEPAPACDNRHRLGPVMMCLHRDDEKTVKGRSVASVAADRASKAPRRQPFRAFSHSHRPTPAVKSGERVGVAE